MTAFVSGKRVSDRLTGDIGGASEKERAGTRAAAGCTGVRENIWLKLKEEEEESREAVAGVLGTDARGAAALHPLEKVSVNSWERPSIWITVRARIRV
jgi:hypothetical protein